jgi:riboflavin biosynthesis pyrimidine reductase
VLCEGGLKLARSLAKDGLVDEWITVLSPKVIGNLPIRDAAIIPQVSVLCDVAETSEN